MSTTPRLLTVTICHLMFVALLVAVPDQLFAQARSVKTPENARSSFPRSLENEMQRKERARSASPATTSGRASEQARPAQRGLLAQ